MTHKLHHNVCKTHKNITITKSNITHNKIVHLKMSSQSQYLNKLQQSTLQGVVDDLVNENQEVEKQDSGLLYNQTQMLRINGDVKYTRYPIQEG